MTSVSAILQRDKLNEWRRGLGSASIAKCLDAPPNTGPVADRGSRVHALSLHAWSGSAALALRCMGSGSDDVE